MPREYTPAIDCTNQARLPIALIPVTSNQIRAVGYRHETKTLVASFTRGAGNVYEYPDVEPETACAFVMTDALIIKKLAFLDVVFESSNKDGADAFDADVAITTGELSKLIPDLIDALGGILALEAAA